MKISTERLKQIIKEEFENINNDELILERGPQIIEAFQPLRDLYNMADDADKEQVENNMIEVFNNIIKSWREERSESGY